MTIVCSNWVFDNDNSEGTLDATDIFSIITVFGQIVPPMIAVSKIIELWSNFNESKETIKIYLTCVEDKTSSGFTYNTIPLGSIIIQNGFFGVDYKTACRVENSLFNQVEKGLLADVRKIDSNSEMDGSGDESIDDEQ
jgi:hypothetical protein